MLPIIIKEGIVILMAGAMLVAGSLNIINAPGEESKTKIMQTKEKKLSEITDAREEWDWTMRKLGYKEKKITINGEEFVMHYKEAWQRVRVRKINSPKRVDVKDRRLFKTPKGFYFNWNNQKVYIEE